MSGNADDLLSIFNDFGVQTEDKSEGYEWVTTKTLPESVYD